MKTFSKAMTKSRRNPTTEGTSRALWPVLLVIALTLGPAAQAKEKLKKPQQAILAGGIYDEAGFALAGIRIEVRRPGEKKAKWEAMSDARGEFAVRVPAGRATYVVATASKKHLNQEQTVEIVSHERAEVLFRLRPRAGAEAGGKP